MVRHLRLRVNHGTAHVHAYQRCVVLRVLETADCTKLELYQLEPKALSASGSGSAGSNSDRGAVRLTRWMVW